MTPINLRSLTATLLVVVATVAFLSFSTVPGGDSYEVYLNNGLMIKEYLYGRTEAPIVPLNMVTNQDELSVTFSHCGKIGTSRKIALKDEHDATLKEWTFADSPDVKNRMRIKANEISSHSGKNARVRLLYSSSEASSGVHLVTFQLTDATAKKK